MSQSLGRIGEYLCAATLEELSVKCSIVNQSGFDILAFVGERVVRIQVKSTSCIRQINDRPGQYYTFLCAKNSKKKKITKKDADIVALVAIDRRLVYFITVEKVTGLNKRIRPEVFDNENIEKESWNDCINTKPSPVRNRDTRGKSERDHILSSLDAAAD